MVKRTLMHASKHTLKHTLGSLCLLLAISSAAASTNNEYAQQWQQPLQITLPEPTRSVLLSSMVEPAQWLAEHNITDAQLLRQGRSTMVQFPMSEENWAMREEALCGSPGVAACDAGACKTIMFRAQAGNASDTEKVKARIIETPPDIEETETLEENGGVCRSIVPPPLLPPESGAVPNLTLDFSQMPRRDDARRRATSPSSSSTSPSTSSDAASTQTGPDLSLQKDAATSPQVADSAGATDSISQGEGAQTPDTVAPDTASAAAESSPTEVAGFDDTQTTEAASADGAATDQPGATDSGSSVETEASEVASAETPAAEPFDPMDLYSNAAAALRAVDFQLQVAPNFTDGANLSSSQLPADTTDYSLMVGEGCQAVTVPLSSVAPARVPNLIVALVNGDPATVGAVHRLSPIKQSQLASTGDTLVVYYSARPVPQVLPLLRLDSNFLMVEPEHIFTTSAAAASYSDPLATFTYGPAHTGALALHSDSTGQGETIAVIDTGVALEHPDLQGRVKHEDFTDLGWSEDAHGTAVASIIAAAANNGLGSYGVAPDANILALKACQPKQEGGLAARCWTSSLVKALDAAISQDAQIINMSLAGPPDEILSKYVELAVTQNRLVIAGAGNGGPQALPAFPAAIPGVLAVTAIDRNNRPYRDANQGDYIDIAAPGVDIITASPGEGFPASSGTSWAAAHVSGIAALLKPLMPLATPADIAFLLRSETTDLGAPGKDQQFGYGVVDACAAASVATAQAITCGEADISLERSIDSAE